LGAIRLKGEGTGKRKKKTGRGQGGWYSWRKLKKQGKKTKLRVPVRRKDKTPQVGALARREEVSRETESSEGGQTTGAHSV